MWTIKQFETVYDRYRSSGLRVREFCRNECIQESKFYYWQRRLRKHNLRQGQPSEFIPIVFSGPGPAAPGGEMIRQNPVSPPVIPDSIYEITYPNGVTVRVPARVDTDRLRSLIFLTP